MRCCIDCMMCFYSGSAARLNKESPVTQPPDQVRHHALSRALSHSATFSDCFLVVLFSHLCPAEIGTFKTRTIKTLKYATQSH